MDDNDLIPLIPMTYVQRVRELIAEYEAQLRREPGNVYARLCLQGWRRELERLEEGRIY